MNATSPGPHDHHHAMPHADGAPGKGHEQHRALGAGGHDDASVHDRHEGHSVAMFRDRFWITLLISIPTLAWSGMVQQMVGNSEGQGDLLSDPWTPPARIPPF